VGPLAPRETWWPRCGHGYAAGLPAGAGTDPVKTKKNIHFEFSQELVREPLLYQINRSFDVVVNIRGASVTDEGGFIALELEGEDGEIRRVLDYLRNQGVKLGEGLGGGPGGAIGGGGTER
jgi:L-aspartate semialdehyde sulfurtransferase ferredoxin